VIASVPFYSLTTPSSPDPTASDHIRTLDGMLPPVRCFGCGMVLGDKWQAFTRMQTEARQRQQQQPQQQQQQQQHSSDQQGGADGAESTATGEILDKLGITKLCCRSCMISTVDMSLVI
jgi:DNA-directed RNA polymerase subunit N (RpoN/RPB10)